MVDSWLVAHALPPGITTTLHNVEETDENDDDVNENASNTWSNNSCSQLTQTEQQQQQETNNGASGQPALTPGQQPASSACNRSISGSGSKNSSGYNRFFTYLSIVMEIC